MKQEIIEKLEEMEVEGYDYEYFEAMYEDCMYELEKSGEDISEGYNIEKLISDYYDNYFNQ